MNISGTEKISERESIIHSLNPLFKIFITIEFLLAVTSVPKYDVSMLIGFLFYPIILIEMSGISKKLILKRILITLPFCVFMGISNLVFDSEVWSYIGNISITYGALSFLSLIIKVILTVASVYILVFTTPMEKIFYGLAKIKVPKIIVVQLLLSYRYIFVILKEVKNMYIAYSLRSGSTKGIKIEHMGTFIGQILLKSFNNAEEIYYAMKCRGFEGIYPLPDYDNIKLKDYIYIIAAGLSIMVFRIFNISLLMNNIFLNIFN